MSYYTDLDDFLGQEMQALDHIRDYERDQYEKKINGMIARYNDNASASVGATISCACCGAKINKNNYQTQFCRNKGKGNCKDRFWNNTSDDRRHRAQTLSRLRIDKMTK